MIDTKADDRALRWPLNANTVFSFVSGVVAAAGAQPLSDFSGVDPLVLRILGIGLVLWASIIFKFAQRRPLRRSEALIVIAGDVAWIMGSLIVLAVAGDAFTGGGLAAFVVIGAVVAGFALLQLRGLTAVS